jgi:hypothetical protein
MSDIRQSEIDADRLGYLAARAIQATAMAVPEIQSSAKTQLYRGWVANYMAELREIMGAEWVEERCGWPTP